MRRSSRDINLATDACTIVAFAGKMRAGSIGGVRTWAEQVAGKMLPAMAEPQRSGRQRAADAVSTAYVTSQILRTTAGNGPNGPCM